MSDQESSSQSWSDRVEFLTTEHRRLMKEEAQQSILDADGSTEIYFIRESGMGAIKIGITEDLSRRISSMRSNTPHELTILGSVHAGKKLEVYLKWRFSGARIQGEWFRPIDGLVKYIEELTAFKTAQPRMQPEPEKDTVAMAGVGLIEWGLSQRSER